MKFQAILKFSILSTAVMISSCSSDDNGVVTPTLPTVNFEIPATYKFTNEAGESTVSFGGQTTRLEQGAEILKDFTTFGTTEEVLDKKFTDGEGFVDVSLNNGKKLKGKVAESIDFFAVNSVEQAEIRGVFDGYISEQAAILLSQYASIEEVPVAARGKVGKLGKRLVTKKGLELNQAFNKGLIGALTLDQIINDYLSLTERVKVREDNDNGVKVEGKPYTDAEHFWDEAYGYLYGASDADVLDNPNTKHLDDVADNFLYKYVQRVNGDADFNTIADEIFQAFKTGRAAIVAKDYEESEKQANILRKKLSEVIGIRAVFYLKQGAKKISDDGSVAINDGSAFHDWSEGYGFVYSLRFTQDPATGQPYFTKQEVDGFIATLDAGDGFWDLTNNLEVANDMAATIASRFDFTVAQAESTAAAQ